MTHLVRVCSLKSIEDVDKGHTIQPPPESQNMFEYLGLPVSFEVEESLLKKRFRELQSAVHPDRFAHASKHEKEISDEHSRRLNESYKTLSEPYLRAKYLLKLLGESNSTKKDLDPASLMEMMEWNERVAEMKTEDELTAEKTNVQNQIDEILKELGKQFAEKSLDGVRTNITRLSYLYSLRNSIDKKLESMMGI
ncbi:hypothetical protein OESDEN_08288 [Oesophagostomum dentatum]|uniref:J domain-containing protein n=1 Tax=Oesophagostomum dentatum TaxID=61180 RepID=A0A0B1T8X1_OESDE|nr:hypothetical protein OESDEN_08288 [Oesophagostomum dentatum]